VGEEREPIGGEPEEKDDVEGHYFAEAPNDAPAHDSDEGADVEGHMLNDAPNDAPND
jgi:hypothetical protein